MYTIKELSELINTEFSNEKFEKNPTNLYMPIKYTLSEGGKRIRPLLVLAACNMFCETPTVAIDTAKAYEIFHNFTLLHDDVMDHSPIRRGRPTVHEKWNMNTAILSGDAMMILAWQYILKTPDFCLRENISLFNKTALEVCEGQQFDMDFENIPNVSEQDYLEMIRLKTSVLLAACLKSGALLGGAQTSDAELLYDFGINLGLAFQLQDDYLDVYGNAETFGKRIGGDILAEKKTFLMVKAKELDGDDCLKNIYSNQQIDDETKIKAVTEIYNKLSIRRLTEEKIDYFFQKARACFSQISVHEERKRNINEISDSLMNRKK
jgi:geranylgeranyl diphosphate synthase type II